MSSSEATVFAGLVVRVGFDLTNPPTKAVRGRRTPNKPFILDRLTGITFLDNRKERVQFDKITARVSRLCYGLDAEHVDAAAITQKVISGVYQGVTTVELDNLVRISSLTRTRRESHTNQRGRLPRQLRT